MSIDPQLGGAAGRAGSTSPVGAQAGRSAPQEGLGADSAAGGAAFRALLERLERSAEAIGEASDLLNDPRQLGAVVEKSRVSVEEAMTLGNDLLEAFRAAQQRAAGGSESAHGEPDPENGRS